jgi:plastocyanin
MHQAVRLVLALVVTLALGACGTAATPGTSTSNVPASAAPPSEAPASVAASSDGGSGAACAPAESGATSTATVTIKNFAYSPEPVTAKVGDVIGWTNDDSAGHTATLDDGTCTTDTIADGATGALVFNAPGTYPYHCNIHPAQMKGTITVSG